MKHCSFISLLIAFFVFSVHDIYCQLNNKDSIPAESGCKPKDILDIIWPKRQTRPHNDKKLETVFLPHINYNPLTGLLVGAGGKFAWHVGSPQSNKISAATIGADITTHKQFVFQIQSTIYTPKNNWLLQGDWRYYFYNLPTYGLGTTDKSLIPALPGLNLNPASYEQLHGAYTIVYNWLRIHQLFLHQLGSGIYGGVGAMVDYHYNIDDDALDLDSSHATITPHYSYSISHGFNLKRYTSSGPALIFVFDTRDNQINPYRGFYVNLCYLYNTKWFGSSMNGSQLWTEFRTYISLSKKSPRHLFAFWVYGSFKTSGEIPFLDLMATGFDQMNSSGRGYIQGRWRGENYVYGETEYRFPISPCSQILGGVIFVNTCTASSKDNHVPLFGYFQSAIGVGIRVMIFKKSRTNLTIDSGFGNDSNGLYGQSGEIF